jgi:hypothetical protein
MERDVWRGWGMHLIFVGQFGSSTVANPSPFVQYAVRHQGIDVMSCVVGGRLGHINAGVVGFADASHGQGSYGKKRCPPQSPKR